MLRCRRPEQRVADALRSRELVDVVRTGYGQGANPLSRERVLREGGASAAIATSHFVYAAVR